MMSSLKQGLSSDELDGRLNCFGEFESSDHICSTACALCINCAIAKNRFLGFQLLEDSGVGFSPYDNFEIE